MVSPNVPITQADMDALAALANAKLTPATDYAFPPFAGKDVIASPVSVVATAAYGSGSFNDGSMVEFWLFPYRMIAGKKTYTYSPVTTVFTGVAGSGNFTLTWAWTSPVGVTAPDGYVAISPSGFSGGYTYFWKDIGNLHSLTEDGTFSTWAQDLSLNDQGDAINTPCAIGIWLKMLNRIHSDFWNKTTLFGGTDITFDPSFILSGPWCVSVAPKCYLKLNSTAIYFGLEFWYSEHDSATGNQIAPEADMLTTYIGVENGANSLDWSENVLINGRIIIFSEPSGQSITDWGLSASDPGIVISFNPNYFDDQFPPSGRLSTAMIFDFTNVQYTVGTPIVLTTTPLAGQSVIDAGNPFGTGGLVNCVFTGDKTTYAATDIVAIHYADVNAKKAALPNSLLDIVLSTHVGGTFNAETHHRVFCNGVFVATTIPTLGVMPYLDQDLPQYSPNNLFPASTRRTPLDAAKAYIPSVNNRGALWPIFRDSDFIPDSVFGQPLNGSAAWQTSIFTKFISEESDTSSVVPSGIAQTLTNTLSPFVQSGSAGIRFIATNPLVTLYAKAGAFPTTADFDVSSPGGVWISAPSGFADNTYWFVGILNPTNNNVNVTSISVVIEDGTTPNGTFFPTNGKDDNGDIIPQKEGYSYHFSDPPSIEFLPIPMFGYCVYSLTARRLPVDNGFGVSIAPSVGTSALSVDVGIMQGFGWGAQGTFQKIQTITIPSGQAEVTVSVFLPVLSGTPLAHNSNAVSIRASVNFQPQMHSEFDRNTVKVSGSDYTVGYYSGHPWFDQNKALLTFIGGEITQPIVLPISATVYNDLEAVLNLLP